MKHRDDAIMIRKNAVVVCRHKNNHPLFVISLLQDRQISDEVLIQATKEFFISGVGYNREELTVYLEKTPISSLIVVVRRGEKDKLDWSFFSNVVALE